jgi:DNA-binding SARP family transcriptional activator
MVYCLPLEAAGEKVGVVQLGYGEKDPSPQTKYLPFLLNVSEEAAQVVQQAKANQQAEDRAATMLREWKHRLNGNDGNLNAAEERPSLEIRCLGPFELYRDGSLILSEAFPRRRASTLLKMLLVHEGRPVPRDLLAELLWPETDPGVAANRIYGLVHILRRVLEPGRNGGASVHILNDGDRYRFVGGDSFRLDLQEFREYIRLGQRMDRDGETLSAISSYETAVGLYRGDLLEDEPYAEWCWDQRASVQEMLLDASKRLAALHMDQGSPQESINLYRHALGIDPLREEIHQRLMRALWVAGQREEASRQYQVCREILLRELGVAPLPETEELHSLIRGRREP